jgi:6-phosphogluconolactonase
VTHDLTVLPNPQAVAEEAAERIADVARAAVAERGRFTFAVSGGSSPWMMFDELTRMHMPWGGTEIYQVDERIAPNGDETRNLTHLRASLGDAIATAKIFPMPVEDADLDQAVADYSATLPERFDAIHLGLGPDGHTASLVPGDPVLEVQDQRVAVTTNEYQGTRRMTLTYPALTDSDLLLWLVTGEEKQEALGKLLEGDPSIPAGRVEAPVSEILADAAAASED